MSDITLLTNTVQWVFLILSFGTLNNLFQFVAFYQKNIIKTINEKRKITAKIMK